MRLGDKGGGEAIVDVTKIGEDAVIRKKEIVTVRQGWMCQGRQEMEIDIGRKTGDRHEMEDTKVWQGSSRLDVTGEEGKGCDRESRDLCEDETGDECGRGGGG